MKKIFIPRIIIILSIFSFWFFIPVFAQTPDSPQMAHFTDPGKSTINLSNLNASLFTGEATTSVPIELPHMAGSIEEEINLELQYRSGGQDSWVGTGWSLELGQISKMNKFGVNNPNNPYMLVLNGANYELVNIGGSQYRTKMETNMRIDYNGAIWQVWNKDGTLYKFDLVKGESWFLSKVTNTLGASITIEYDQPNDNEIYLKQIRYPDSTTVFSPYCKVVFTTQDRVSYLPLTSISRRLKSIQIYIKEVLQKQYNFNYAADGTTLISLLSSIVEASRDGKELPPVSFSYQQPLRDSFLNSETAALADTEAVYFSPSNVYTGTYNFWYPTGINMAFVDLNKDNLLDFIACKAPDSNASDYDKNKIDWVVHLNTGNGFSAQEDKWLDGADAVYQGDYSYEHIGLGTNAMLADMNKDGLPDLVYSVPGGKISVPNGSKQTSYNTFVRYNTGTKFSDTPVKLVDYTESLKVIYIGDGYYDIQPIIIGRTATIADMNGDNLPDLVFNRMDLRYAIGNRTPIVYTWWVRLNTGSGFSPEEKLWLDYIDNAFFEQANYWMASASVANSKLIDMNKDGLVDLVFNTYAGKTVVNNEYNSDPTSTTIYAINVRINTGQNFSSYYSPYLTAAPAYYFPNPESKTISICLGKGANLADINNDGLPDLVYNEYKMVQTSGGKLPSVSWYVCLNQGSTFLTAAKLLDSIGYYFNNNNYYTNPITENTYFADINKDGVTDIVYPRFNQWQYYKGYGFTLNAFINKSPIAVNLLNQQTSIFGGTTNIAYDISSNYNNKGDDDKDDLGLITTVVKSVTQNPGIGLPGTTTYNYEGGWFDIPNRQFRGFRHVQSTDPLGFVSDTYFHQSDAKLGKPEKETDVGKIILYTYKDDDTAPYFTPLIQVDNWMNAKCSRVSYAYDDYGNIIKTVYYGDADKEGDEKSVLTDYALNTTAWLVSLPSRERAFANQDTTGNPTSENQYYYDGNANYTDSPAKGNLTKIKKYLDTKNAYIENSFTYDAFGNQITSTDSNGNTTTTEYENEFNFLPKKITNPKGHVELFYYCAPYDTRGLFGQLGSTNDANSNNTGFEYDGFGRKIKVHTPYDQYSIYGSQSYEYGLNGAGANYILTRTTEQYATDNNLITVSILDGFGREIQSIKESEVPKRYSFVTKQYNNRGEIAKTSLPYFVDTDSIKAYLQPDDTIKWTEFSYDALGRTTNIAKPDGTINAFSFSDWSTTTTDSNLHRKTYINDAYGRLASVKEKNRDEEYLTSYSYDSEGNLTQIKDHFGNKFQFFYDSLGRKNKEIDPDLGTWTYNYDNNGNLINSTNANGISISYAYDSLNRILSKDYSGHDGIETTYNYDETTSTNGIGRRTSMSDLSGSTKWFYDKEARLVKQEKNIDGTNYVIEWAYDAMDRVTSLIYPNAKRVDFQYNNAGLSESANGYIANAEYNAVGQPLILNYANPVTTRFDYYSLNLRPKSILSGSFQDLRYNYDNVGNITAINDAVRANTRDYTYDDLDRLLSGDGNFYEYNAIGNITKSNGLDHIYSLSKPHALIGEGKNTYFYDDCGNMISGAGRTISYNAENRPTRITKDGIITELVYDGDNNLVKKIVTNNGLSSVTIYIEDLYEEVLE